MPTVKLYLRNDSPDLTPGMPTEISSTFASEDEAQAQAVADLQAGNRTYSPVRIEDESGNILADRAALEKSAK